MIINESRKLNEVAVHHMSNGTTYWQSTDKNGKTHYYMRSNPRDDKKEIGPERFKKMVAMAEETTSENDDYQLDLLQRYTQNKLDGLTSDQIDRLEDLLTQRDEELKRKRKESRQEYIDRISKWISNTSNWIDSNLIQGVIGKR